MLQHQLRHAAQHMGPFSQGEARPADKGLIIQGYLGRGHVARTWLPNERTRPSDEVMGERRLSFMAAFATSLLHFGPQHSL